MIILRSKSKRWNENNRLKALHNCILLALFFLIKKSTKLREILQSILHIANLLDQLVYFFQLKNLLTIKMHTDNLLDLFLPKLIPFILKDLSNQDLKNFRNINAPSIRDFRRERFHIFSNLVRKKSELLSENKIKVLMDGLQALVLDEILKSLSPEQWSHNFIFSFKDTTYKMKYLWCNQASFIYQNY